jgi:hypothetical protein
VALLLFAGVTALALPLVWIYPGPTPLVRLVAVQQVLMPIGMLVGVVGYLVARRDLLKWVQREQEEAKEANRATNAARPKCLRCGVTITGSEQPWQKESFCSAKCRDLAARAP